MLELMFDLETLGTKPNCVVTAIGGVFFTAEPEKCVDQKFHLFPNRQQQIDRGRSIDDDTLTWWFKQEEEARTLFTSMKQDDVVLCLNGITAAIKLREKVGGHGDVRVWGNGSHFDITILESLYHDFNLKVPWKFSKVMDLRTFSRFVAKGAPRPKPKIPHNALSDAIAQVEYIHEHYPTSRQKELLDNEI